MICLLEKQGRGGLSSTQLAILTFRCFILAAVAAVKWNAPYISNEHASL